MDTASTPAAAGGPTHSIGTESGPRPVGKRVPKGATVVSVRKLSGDMVRLHARVQEPELLPELGFSDSYVKVLLTPAAAGYTWPFDPEEVRATRPREQWPLTRTYTIRAYDPATALMTLDLVVHEGGGAAQPWIHSLHPDDVFGFLGPGGKWRPDPGPEHFLLIGDSSALPAIAAAMEVLPRGARAEVFLEVAGEGSEVRLPEVEGVEVTWVHTGTSLPGSRLVQAVTRARPEVEDTGVFLHGNAEMVRDLRRHLLGERGLERSALSASGYWRHGCTDEQWRAQKREFNEEMDRELVRQAPMA